MVEAIVGKKGVGKTATIFELITKLSENEENNIVCIENGKRFDGHVPFTVRLVDIQEFNINGYGELLAFISGIIAKDFDISNIFVDSIYKVANVEDSEGLAEFIKSLDELSKEWHVDINVTISDDYENLPEEIKPFVVKHDQF